MDQILNNFQVWALQNPEKIFSRLFMPLISLVEGLIANNAVYLDAKRQALGLNFCCAGEVVLGDFPTLETALT